MAVNDDTAPAYKTIFQRIVEIGIKECIAPEQMGALLLRVSIKMMVTENYGEEAFLSMAKVLYRKTANAMAKEPSN